MLVVLAPSEYQPFKVTAAYLPEARTHLPPDTADPTMPGMTTRAHTTLYGRPITFDSLDDLFAHHRARFGGWQMVDPPADPPADPPPSNDPPADPPADPPVGEKTFTQADLDKLIGERLAKEKVKYDQQIKDLTDNAGKSEVEKLTAERDRYKDQAESGSKSGAERLAKAEAKTAALAAGGRGDRLAKIVAEANLDGVVDDDGTVDETKLKTAVDKVLTDFPEWKANPGSSGGELGGKDAEGKPTFTRQQIKDMSPEERAKRVDELNEAMAAGRITG